MKTSVKGKIDLKMKKRLILKWFFKKLTTLVLSEVGLHPLMLSLFAELFLLCSLQLAESELFDKGRQHGTVSAAPYLVGLPYMGNLAFDMRLCPSRQHYLLIRPDAPSFTTNAD